MLGNRIKHFRIYNKIEPEAIARTLNISVEEYLKYENGSVTPDISTISELAKIYKVTINEFYGNIPRLTLNATEKDELFYSSDEELEIFKFAELSIDEKEIILAYRTSENKEKLFNLMTKNKRD